MPGRKKNFPCGHSGRGQYCHTCRQAEETRQRDSLRKLSWQERLAAAPVDLSRLPRHVAEKTLEIIAELQNPDSRRRLSAKRMVTLGQRHIVRFEIGWSYRLICRETDTGLEFIEVISHETYNSRLNSGGWA